MRSVFFVPDVLCHIASDLRCDMGLMSKARMCTNQAVCVSWANTFVIVTLI